MAGETVITIVGNLTADPELRWIGDGTAVASFTIASTPRTFDRASNSWKDGEAIFMRCSAWRDLGENCAESLKKGMRVVAQGRLQQRSWESQKSGERHTSIELTIDEIGPSLRYATAHVERNQRREGGFGGPGNAGGGNYGGNADGYGNGGNAGNGGNGGYGGGNQAGYGNQGAYGAPGGAAGDPWGYPAGAPGEAAPDNSSFDQEPPF